LKDLKSIGFLNKKDYIINEETLIFVRGKQKQGDILGCCITLFFYIAFWLLLVLTILLS